MSYSHKKIRKEYTNRNVQRSLYISKLNNKCIEMYVAYFYYGHSQNIPVQCNFKKKAPIQYKRV